MALHSDLPYDFWLSLGIGLPRRIDWPLDAVGAAASALATGAIIDVLRKAKAGVAPSYRGSMVAAARVFGWLYVANFVVHVITLIAALALVIPAIVVAVRYAFVPYAVVLEGARPVGALRRSAELTRGIRWRFFGVGVLLLGALSVLALVIHLRVTALHAIGDAPVSTFLAHLIGDGILGVTGVFAAAVIFVFYWDAKDAAAAPEHASDKQPGQSLDPE